MRGSPEPASRLRTRQLAPAQTSLRTRCFRKFASYCREVSRASRAAIGAVWGAGPARGLRGSGSARPPPLASLGRWVPGPQLPPGPLLLRPHPPLAPDPSASELPQPRPRRVLLRAQGPGSRPLPHPTSSGGPPPGPGPTPPRAPGRMGDNTSPISVILVSSGSRGNKLLFRYPFQRSQEHPASQTSKWAPGAASLAVSGEAGYRVVSVLAVPSHHRALGKCREVKRSRKRITHSFNMSHHCC